VVWRKPGELIPLTVSESLGSTSYLSHSKILGVPKISVLNIELYYSLFSV
jgi:hypothetical protein